MHTYMECTTFLKVQLPPNLTCTNTAPMYTYLHTQVVYVSKKHGFVILYITATDRVECAEWVSSIRQGTHTWGYGSSTLPRVQ